MFGIIYCSRHFYLPLPHWKTLLIFSWPRNCTLNNVLRNYTSMSVSLSVSPLEPQESIHSFEGHFGVSKEESALSSEGQRSLEIAVQICTPSPPLPPTPPPAPVKEKAPKLFTLSKLSFTVSMFDTHCALKQTKNKQTNGFLSLKYFFGVNEWFLSSSPPSQEAPT